MSDDGRYPVPGGAGGQEDSHSPAPRSRSGLSGRRRPRTGTEPMTARSALGLRLLLSAIYTPLFLAGAVLFAWWAARSDAGSSPSSGALGAVAIVCAVMSLLALADLTVVQHRRRNERMRRRGR
ncbi:DUF6343 family protein [Streptomyces sp. KR80]|uniref:DUF6343 family protein n=1 Tax=Streptomyces sp. KR80 TaxID=3457426 RepID=UPI003FCF9AD7